MTKAWLGRLGLWGRARPAAATSSLAGSKATRRDVVYCYRLLLKREPTPKDWEFWDPILKSGATNLHMLTESFLTSSEFARVARALDEPECVELEDFHIFLRPYDPLVGAVIKERGTYEPHVASELRRLLKAGHTFLDVGANIGFFSLLGAGIVGPTGRVVAVEPNVQDADLLRRSVAANGFANVDVQEVAAGDRESTLFLEVGAGGTNGRLRSDDARPGEKPRSPVRVVALDDWLSLDRLDVVKMDIEGAEPSAWRGMRRMLARHRPVVILEFSPTLIEETTGETPASFVEAVLGAGYRLDVLDPKTARRTPADPSEVLARSRRVKDAGGTHLDLVAYC